MVKRLSVALALAGVALWAQAAVPGRRLWVLVPVFSAAESGAPLGVSLGSKVSTLMFLQLFTTLRKHPTPNPKGLDFGDAGITWDSEALAPSTYEEADRLAGWQDQ